VEKRLGILIVSISEILYTNVSRGLFERDKLIYSFLIATSIKRQSKAIDEAVWNLLLRGPTVFTSKEAEARPESPDHDVLSLIPWDTLYSAELRAAGQFAGICQHVVDNWGAWRDWSQQEEPYGVPVPGEYQENLSLFDKLILLKCLRPELVQQSMAKFIIGELGQYYVEPPATNMEIMYQGLDTYVPMIFVLSQGADPTSLLQKFAYEKEFNERIDYISLGQGQGPKAVKLIDAATAEGRWVMLQNCHLARSWMPALEKVVLGFQEAEDIHPDFRLYLTSMPADYFPVSVLQNSVKLTTEPPRGIRANLKRSYANLTQEDIEDCTKPEIWRKLLFGFAFFHAVIQERRKFGPIGWNIRYEFNDSDLDTSQTMLKLFLDSQDEIPWDALLFITGHINYGGRVTDDNDRRCLLTCLERYCQPDALKDMYKYSPSGIYFAPADGKIESYREYIDQMPLTDNPEIFGLHDNANIKYET